MSTGNEIDSRENLIRRINSSVRFLIRNAVAMQVGRNGKFSFSEFPHNYATYEFDEDISAKFSIQVSQCYKNHAGNAMTLIFQWSGEMASLFEKYNCFAEICARAKLFDDNDTVEISSADDVNLFENIKVEEHHIANINDDFLKILVSNVEKIVAWEKLKLPQGGLRNHPSQTQCERSFLEANELAFMHKSEADKAVPKKLLDACDFIDDLFSETSWKSKLAKNKNLLDDVF